MSTHTFVLWPLKASEVTFVSVPVVFLYYKINICITFWNNTKITLTGIDRARPCKIHTLLQRQQVMCTRVGGCEWDGGIGHAPGMHQISTWKGASNKKIVLEDNKRWGGGYLQTRIFLCVGPGHPKFSGRHRRQSSSCCLYCLVCCLTKDVLTNTQSRPRPGGLASVWDYASTVYCKCWLVKQTDYEIIFEEDRVMSTSFQHCL